MINDSRRTLSEVQFSNLFTVAKTGISECINSGINPTEIWLGPGAESVFRTEIEYQYVENRILGPKLEKVAIERENESIEDTTFLGLKIMLMKSEGVRVGSSIDVTNNKQS
jgi:hypothetical protein